MRGIVKISVIDSLEPPHSFERCQKKKKQQQQQQTAICDKVFKNGPSKVWKTVFKKFEGV